MNEYEFNKLQTIELSHLLEEIGDDPFLAPQFRERLAQAEAKLRSTHPPSNVPMPRMAMFLRGGGVDEASHAVRPSLAADVLTQYEKMYTEQAIYNEREIAQNSGKTRRPKGSVTPKLWFTGTPHGSFGLEFVPEQTDDPALAQAHTDAITKVTDSLLEITTSDEASADRALMNVIPPVIAPLRHLLRSLSTHGAELRLSIHGRASRSVSTEQISTAVKLLDREVVEEEVVLHGTFRGVTLQSGYFDFLTVEGSTITGRVATDMPPEFLSDALKLTDLPSEAIVLKTTVKPITGQERVDYVLRKARAQSGRPGLPLQ